MRPRAGELLWDIGCGSGSIAIEWLLRHQANRAIGIERDPLRAARAARNAAELGVPRLEMVTGEALPTLDKLPTPDAIFIGGGGEPALIDKAFAALKPGGRIVANAVTLDTEQAVFAAQAQIRRNADAPFGRAPRRSRRQAGLPPRDGGDPMERHETSKP